MPPRGTPVRIAQPTRTRSTRWTAYHSELGFEQIGLGAVILAGA